MTRHSEPRLCTARSSGRPAVLAPHQPVDLLPPDGRQMAARSPSAGRAPHTVSCSPDADTDGSPCSPRSPWRTARHWGPRRAPASHPQRRLSIVTLCPFSFSLMKGHALKQSNAMVISPSCPPPQDAPPSASGTAAGTARQPSFWRRRAATRPGGGDKAASTREKRLDRLLVRLQL